MESTNTAQTESYDIYTGVWTDWSRDKILGLTLTLGRRDGNLLVAFLALFVSFAGTSFWRIACCFLHHCFSADTAQDGVYHQRQAILRNSYNGMSGLTGLIQTLFAWRNHGKRTYTRLLPVLCFAVCCVLIFGAAGTFSSRISTSIGNEVLVQSTSKCGYTDLYKDTDLMDVQTIFIPHAAQVGTAQANYAQQCYSNATLQDCDAFVKKQLPTTITRNASCPFSEEMCRTPDRNIVFDTGYLDSHKDLGINTPPEDRVLFRRVSACAPLVTDGYRRFHNYSDRSPYAQYYYGRHAGTLTGLADEETRNLTIEWPYATLGGVHIDFDITPIDAFVINGSMTNDYSRMQPIPALALPEADLHFFFLAANSLIFTQEVDDPWYAAHRTMDTLPVDRGAKISGKMQAIMQDEPLVPLACSVSEQYCNPNVLEGDPGRCPRMGGSYESEALARDIWSSKRQRSVYRWIAHVNTLVSPTIDMVPKLLGSAGLTARYRAQSGVQGPLPDDQWQLETEYWHAAALVALQWHVVAIATGPSDEIMPWLVRLNGTDESFLCNNLKVYDASYLNFSVVGLIVILCIGGLLILLSYIIEPVIGCVQKRRKDDGYSRLEWATNETLQLQRLAHEELGFGIWRHCADPVPVTKNNEPLAMLDLTDRKHPRLKTSPLPCDLDGSITILAQGKVDRRNMDSGEAGDQAGEISFRPRISTVQQDDYEGSHDTHWRAEVSDPETIKHANLQHESPVSSKYTNQDSVDTLVGVGCGNSQLEDRRSR